MPCHDLACPFSSVYMEQVSLFIHRAMCPVVGICPISGLAWSFFRGKSVQDCVLKKTGCPALTPATELCLDNLP